MPRSLKAMAMQVAATRAGALVRVRVAVVRVRVAAVRRRQAAAVEVDLLPQDARVEPLAAARLIATAVRCRLAWVA
jgi:hypothetical protein